MKLLTLKKYELVEKDYVPIKPIKRKSDALARRNLFFVESIYRYRSVGECYFRR